jgi:hypothetical protein
MRAEDRHRGGHFITGDRRGGFLHREAGKGTGFGRSGRNSGIVGGEAASGGRSTFPCGSLPNNAIPTDAFYGMSLRTHSSWAKHENVGGFFRSSPELDQPARYVDDEWDHR